MELTSIPIKNEQIYFQIVEGNGFLINAPGGKIRIVNPTGAIVWELIDGQKSIYDIAQILESSYENTILDIQSDLINFLQTLIERSLIYLKQE